MSSNANYYEKPQVSYENSPKQKKTDFKKFQPSLAKPSWLTKEYHSVLPRSLNNSFGISADASINTSTIANNNTQATKIEPKNAKQIERLASDQVYKSVELPLQLN